MEKLRNELHRFLRKRLDDLGGVKLQLYKEFKSLAEDEKLASIDKRTLVKISEGMENVQLTVGQLKALHRYMQVCREPGLLERPLFYTEDNLLQSFLPEGRVTNLLGSRPIADKGGGYFSQSISTNDVRAMTAMLEASPLRNRQFRVADFVATENGTAKRSEEEYDRKLSPSSQGAVIAFGSPRANRGSEVLACRMMGLTPFEQPRSDCRLPCRFVFEVSSGTAAPGSALFIPKQEASQVLCGDAREAFRSFRARSQRATIIGQDTVYISDDEIPQDGACYGVLLAQRRDNGDVGMCVWGTSSPATVGLSQLVAEPDRGIKRKLPDYRDTWARQPILVAVAKAEVELQKAGKGQSDRRVVHNPVFVGEPRLFYACDNQWVEQG